MNQEESSPKLHIDQDWKEEARKEKERLAEQEKKRQESGEDGESGQMPKPDFRGLVGLLTSQALSGLGMYGDRKSGRVIVDLEGSRFFIDLLGVLEEKTKGNLSEEETKELREVTSELRSRFIQIAQMVAKQGTDPDAASPDDARAAGAVIDPSGGSDSGGRAG